MESLQRWENAAHNHEFQLARRVGASLELNRHLGNTFVSIHHSGLGKSLCCRGKSASVAVLYREGTVEANRLAWLKWKGSVQAYNNSSIIMLESL